MSNDKEGEYIQETRASLIKNIRIFPFGHGLCGSVGSIKKDSSQNTLSSPLLALTMIDPATG
jgi:hypothetical protein